MSTRHFADAHGLNWDVWDVHPHDVPERHSAESRLIDGAPLARNLADGWLCFQAGNDRRRFAPIPRNWRELPETVLRVMLDVSDAVRPALATRDLIE
jgi:hypothetical protein